MTIGKNHVQLALDAENGLANLNEALGVGKSLPEERRVALIREVCNVLNRAKVESLLTIRQGRSPAFLPVAGLILLDRFWEKPSEDGTLYGGYRLVLNDRILLKLFRRTLPEPKTWTCLTAEGRLMSTPARIEEVVRRDKDFSEAARSLRSALINYLTYVGRRSG